MTKLASVRGTRASGPEQMKYRFKLAHAVACIDAMVLAAVGVVFFLPGWFPPVGILCLIVALLAVVCVNSQLPLVTLDPQLVLIEIAAPLVEAIVGLLFVGFILFSLFLRGTFDSIVVDKETDDAFSLLIVASVYWLLGCLDNAVEVYENPDTRVQSIPTTESVLWLIATTLFLVATILRSQTWNLPSITMKTAESVIPIAIAAAGPLLVADITNMIGVLDSQEVLNDLTGGVLESLWGGAQEDLERTRRRRSSTRS